ncbi:DEHA2A10340p [Debaryomyces hansenii CBS767]|uniref:Potassium transport protein n=1 Tax=Debaryomyces hansenii (strain ATCC 36239 / CBS 767 / BCRC 21394 / JCM 1990 / NBRC 0083 / IGC 2968) TaxID=284592 RepID=Q6BYD8_DEBHA|nr:DEHA2A10340p [Debaryomyces hansenii CBS767]CAG84747.2 DEHA2A10340p [Debaryomyces hansenii CBS767]|eukprot:XP_456781.2 DEHA2A10340p [Debaryomyces hansenii CBS767]
MNRVSKLWHSYKRHRVHGDTGLKIRNAIHRTTEKVYPYVKVVIPNFRAAHYTYILFMTFLGSVIFYPIRNIRYIDALFFTGCASTQAGLNTVNLNRLALYQQILIYIITTLTTPIFIHGSLLFIRLYWFERHFDNIKESSKLNNKMRRNATLAARTQSLDPTRLNTEVNRGLGLNNPQSSGPEPVIDEVAFSNSSSTSPASKHSSPPQNPSINSNNVNHISEPSDTDISSGVAPDSRNPINLSRPESPPRSLDGIRFGNLPQPSKIRQKEIEPSDMYMSIAMLQDNHKSERKDNGDEDDVLIIKSPNEIEKDSQNPIFTKKSQIHFNVNDKPIRKWKKKRRFSRGRQPWSKLKKTFSNSGVSPRKHVRSLSFTSLSNDDDDQSIDSETNNRTTDTDADDDNAIIDDDDDDDEDDGDDDDEDDGDDEDEDDDDEDDEDDDQDDEEDEYNRQNRHDDNLDDIERAQSNLVIPSSDATGGKKFTKRSNTLDVTPGENHELSHSPTFEKMIKSKMKKKKKPKQTKKQKLKYMKSPTVGLNSSLFSPNYNNGSDYDDSDDSDEDDDDEEEDGKSLSKVMSTNYLSWVPTVGRNSTFVHLSEEQKEELGGVEYRAIKLLIKIIVIYYIGFHILAFTCLLPYILYQPVYKADVINVGITPTWWAFFTAQSAFNDLGHTLTPNSMQSFDKSVYVMVIVAFFIVIGNTGFPVMLRFIIWVLFKLSKPMSLFNESLGFLLDHPRRCFTLLFPSVPTWWLFIILVVLNAVDLILFIVLDLNNKYLESTPIGLRVMDGLFQAFSTRTAGFAVVDLSELHPAVQVSYMLMMYISVLPLAISIRRTNVYEEQSLGVYLKDNNDDNDDAPDDKTPRNFIGAHLRNQLSFDLWFIFLGLFIICIAEGPKLNKNNYRFSIFTILFEIISAYGTVGLSLGYPGVDVSLSGEFTVLSKLVMIAMVIRGRHRGLPYALDRAIMLPDDNMQKRDNLQENHAIRRHQTMETSNSLDDGNAFRRAFTRRASSFGFDNTNILGRRKSSVRSSKPKPETPHYIVTTESHEMDDLA